MFIFLRIIFRDSMIPFMKKSKVILLEKMDITGYWIFHSNVKIYGKQLIGK